MTYPEEDIISLYAEHGYQLTPDAVNFLRKRDYVRILDAVALNLPGMVVINLPLAASVTQPAKCIRVLV